MKLRFHMLLGWQLIAVLLLTVACNTLSAPTNSPVVSIPAIDFLLEAETFPSGWIATPCDTSLCRNGGNGDTAAERFFYLPQAPGQALQEAYRFSSEKTASSKFNVYLESSLGSLSEPFIPSDIQSGSQVADEYYFACGFDDKIPQCQLLGRYRNYFVYFYFDLATKQDPGGLSSAEIEKVLQALETRASNLLNSSSGSTTSTVGQP